MLGTNVESNLHTFQVFNFDRDLGLNGYEQNLSRCHFRANPVTECPNRRGNDHSLKQCLISISGTNRHWYSSSTETKIRAVLHNKKLRETKLFEYVDIPKWSFATVCSYKNRILTQKYKEQSITYCKQPADFTRSSTPFSILFSRNIREQVRDNWKKSGNKQEKKTKNVKKKLHNSRRFFYGLGMAKSC